MRTCTGCRAVDAQAALVRLSFDGVHLRAGRGPGRGAYVHARPDCLEGAARGGLSRSFRRAVATVELRSLVSNLSPTVDNPASDPRAGSTNLAGHVVTEAVETAPRFRRGNKG